MCHREQLGAYSHAGWECAIESNWERTVKQARSVQSSAIRSVLQSILGSVHEVHLAACFQLCSMQRDV